MGRERPRDVHEGENATDRGSLREARDPKASQQSRCATLVWRTPRRERPGARLCHIPVAPFASLQQTGCAPQWRILHIPQLVCCGSHGGAPSGGHSLPPDRPSRHSPHPARPCEGRALPGSSPAGRRLAVSAPRSSWGSIPPPKPTIAFSARGLDRSPDPCRHPRAPAFLKDGKHGERSEPARRRHGEIPGESGDGRDSSGPFRGQDPARSPGRARP